METVWEQFVLSLGSSDGERGVFPGLPPWRSRELIQQGLKMLLGVSLKKRMVIIHTRK